MPPGSRHSARVALAALLAALAAAPAQASVTWVVKGHGFGHGVGMSQYGAYGYARHGKGYRFILRHYYRGRRSASSRSRGSCGCCSDRPGDVGFTKATSACGAALNPDHTYEAHLNGAACSCGAPAGKLLAGCGRKLRAAGNGRVRIGGVGPYRGALEIVPTKSDAGLAQRDQRGRRSTHT